MGQIISAGCVCGYRNDHIAIGAGMADFEQHISFPALCRSGKHMVSVNLFALAPCEEGHEGMPVPYTDVGIKGQIGTNKVADWMGRSLTDGTYLCPACEELTLRFNTPHIHFD